MPRLRIKTAKCRFFNAYPNNPAVGKCGATDNKHTVSCAGYCQTCQDYRGTPENIQWPPMEIIKDGRNEIIVVVPQEN